MSVAALEEMRENNIYYILGFMFITGISATFYLITDANNKKFAISTEEESEVFSFTENKPDEQGSENRKDALENLKNSIALLSGQKEISDKDKTEKIVWKMCQYFEISQALIYTKGKEKGRYTLKASYAFVHSENDPEISSGEGLTGQAIIDQKPYLIKDIPEGYLKVVSGLGESIPRSLLIIPCVENGEVKSVFELSSLQEFPKNKFEEIVSICNYISSSLK
jgi:hypothetical protein